MGDPICRGRFSTGVTSESPCPTLDVDGRVVVPIKSKVASRTVMYCIRETLGDHYAAPGTLLGGSPGFDQHKRLTSFLGFVSSYGNEGTPLCVSDRLCKIGIPHHVADT